MIDVREMMLNNFVLYDGKMAAISSVNKRGYVTLGIFGQTVPCADIHPVPLTTELLEKCGFELGTYNNSPCAANKDVFFSFHNKDADLNAVTILGHTLPRIFTPKHLHQLQNLIYILSGNELNVEI